jgi:hypothetical protein
VTQQVTTAISGVLGRAGNGPPPAARRAPVGLARTARAIARLAQARDRLEHVPTVQQVRAMAWLDGREPCSYLLDPERNYVPELPVGGADLLGTYALCFTGRWGDGRRSELVALPNGWAFDLLGLFA